MAGNQSGNGFPVVLFRGAGESLCGRSQQERDGHGGNNRETIRLPVIRIFG